MSKAIAWLSGHHPKSGAGEWRLTEPEFLIGREPPANLILPLPSLSRRHARIACTPDGYWLADLNSRNGTFVNGQAVGSTPVRLHNGDEIVLAGVIALRFHDPAETDSGARLGRLRGIWLDETAREVWVDACRVEPPLSPAQYTLLKLLYDRPGTVFSRSEIIAAVWPNADPSGVSEEALDGLIKRLRSRLRSTRPNCNYIEVLRGHGLRLLQPDE